MSLLHLSRRRALQGTGAAVLAAGLPRFARAAPLGDTLRVSTYGDLQVLDPPFHLSAPETQLCDLLFHHLVVFKGSEDTSWELDAAESIEQVDDTHIKFKLKPGLKWTGDYGTMTAEDVKYSFERVIDPKMESPYAGDWAALDHVEVTDELSGVIVLKEFSATLWTTSLTNNAGMIVCKKAVEALPDKKFTTEVPASSGRYVLKEWTPKQRTVLEANPNWSGEPLPFKQIVIVPIEDTSAAEIAYEAGDLDFTRITLNALSRYRTDGPPAGSKIVEMPSLAYVWIGMNMENPALADIRVRKAVQRAIDVEGAVDAAYFGVAERATGIVAPSLIGHRKIEPMQRDVEAAKALLAEAGVSGLTLTIDVGLETEFKTIGQIVQASLAEAGIDVVINERDSGTFWTLGDRAANPDWKNVQLILNRFSMTPDPSYATEWFTPEQIGIWNWEGFNSAEFAELHKAAKAEKDTAKRAQMYEKMQTLMEDSGAYVFLTHERIAYIHREELAVGLNPAGEPMYRLFRPA
jgi:peptide/nickel transport system substrate-binding protein